MSASGRTGVGADGSSSLPSEEGTEESAAEDSTATFVLAESSSSSSSATYGETTDAATFLAGGGGACCGWGEVGCCEAWDAHETVTDGGRLGRLEIGLGD